MGILMIIGFLLGAVWICSIGPFIGAIISDGFDMLEYIFNPVVIYHNSDNLNIFGVICLVTISTIGFLPVALIFWFYKLCTVGRR